MTRRQRDLIGMLEAIADQFGAIVHIEPTNGSHLRATFTLGARRAFIIMSLTPSDRRSDRWVKADARRTLRQLIAMAAPTVTP